MKSLGIIPARFASSRFPGKPLVEIEGKSMIRRVCELASQALGAENVLVATDDARIFDHVQAFHTGVCMTAETHPSGTDRCAEALRWWLNSGRPAPDIVVNIQGDEPFLDPGPVRQLALQLHQNPAFSIATMARKLLPNEDVFNPNQVKVVFDSTGRALYFSRSAIPYLRDVPAADWTARGLHYQHVGLYAFRANTLLQVAGLPPCPLEQSESLEQLRWLYAGLPILVVPTLHQSRGIDTPEDLEING